jgi:site-specific DNA-methyltransferase (adenine-specific)
MKNTIYKSDAIDVLNKIADDSVDLVYTDPPFGTQSTQELHRQKDGRIISKIGYSDRFDDYLGFLEPHLRGLHRVLKQSGAMYLHLDYRWVHYAKVLSDQVFGSDNFLNEVIWSYNFGGRGKDRWPAKHDTILVYAKKRGDHVFNWDAIDRIPYAAPAMQRVGRTKEEADKRIALGQVPTDVWRMSIVGTQSKERTGYPNQKPMKLIERAITASSPVDGIILDPFAGSGTTGSAAINVGRRFILSDNNDAAIEVMKSRFSGVEVDWVGV